MAQRTMRKAVSKPGGRRSRIGFAKSLPKTRSVPGMPSGLAVSVSSTSFSSPSPPSLFSSARSPSLPDSPALPSPDEPPGRTNENSIEYRSAVCGAFEKYGAVAGEPVGKPAARRGACQRARSRADGRAWLTAVVLYANVEIGLDVGGGDGEGFGFVDGD